MDQATVMGILRAVLTSAGGALVANGTFSSAQWQQIVGVLIVIAGAGWSAVQKRQAHVALIKAASTGTVAPATVASSLSTPQPAGSLKQ